MYPVSLNQNRIYRYQHPIQDTTIRPAGTPPCQHHPSS